jgi:hypothetical protein
MLKGVADLPLHYGKAPRWLFEKMTALSFEITKIMLSEYSEKDFLSKISDPYWFQAFGCVLGFDWHSSGLTTTTTAALKEALEKLDAGITALGGKGKYSNVARAIEDLNISEKKRNELKKFSRLSAKVDNNCVQDNYNLYHHMLFFSEKGECAVIQQGMNPFNRYARRYHWLGIGLKDFLNDPHSGIYAQNIEREVLNLASKKSEETRKMSIDLAKEGPKKILKYANFGHQKNLLQYSNPIIELKMPRHHWININERTLKQLEKIYEINPKDYEEFILIKGVGKEAIRALALISQLVYGTEACWQDPAKFSFAHGGKDGVPFPVNRKVYENSIKSLKEIIEEAEIDKKEKINAFRRLSENF